MIKLKPLIQ